MTVAVAVIPPIPQCSVFSSAASLIHRSPHVTMSPPPLNQRFYGCLHCTESDAGRSLVLARQRVLPRDMRGHDRRREAQRLTWLTPERMGVGHGPMALRPPVTPAHGAWGGVATALLSPSTPLQCGWVGGQRGGIFALPPSHDCRCRKHLDHDKIDADKFGRPPSSQTFPSILRMALCQNVCTGHNSEGPYTRISFISQE